MKTMLRMLPLTALLAIASPAGGQPAPERTSLSVTAEAATEVAETVLFATLAATVEGPRADAAQSTVNETMTRALAISRAVAGVAVTTGGYSVYPWSQDDGTARRYRAEQSLELRSSDPTALLDLVGRLQSSDLEVRNLAYTAPPETIETARLDLTERAFAQLRGGAERAAAAMSMRVARWKELRVEPSGSFMPPSPMRAMRAEAADAAPPVAAAGTQRVTLMVAGTAILEPAP